MPVPPMPARALPTIKALMLGAPPHSAEAPINRAVDARKSFLAENTPNALDHISVLAAEARAKETPSQGTRSTCPKVLTMAG